MYDAVLVPCCGRTFSESSLKLLLEATDNICPMCNNECSPDKMRVNYALRKTINAFKKRLVEKEKARKEKIIKKKKRREKSRRRVTVRCTNIFNDQKVRDSKKIDKIYPDKDVT